MGSCGVGRRGAEHPLVLCPPPPLQLLPSSVAALSECMRSKQQARFFRECQEQMRHALPLGAYLLKPVQRILKYHLLLQVSRHGAARRGTARHGYPAWLGPCGTAWGTARVPGTAGWELAARALGAARCGSVPRRAPPVPAGDRQALRAQIGG